MLHSLTSSTKSKNAFQARTSESESYRNFNFRKTEQLRIEHTLRLLNLIELQLIETFSLNLTLET